MKKLDVLNSKHLREYLEEMGQIREGISVADECYFLLDRLVNVHPDSLSTVLIRLQETKKEYELYEKIEKESLSEKEERERLTLAWLERLKEYSSPLALNLED